MKIQRGFYLLTILYISIQCVFYVLITYAEQHQILLSLEDLIFKFEHSILILILTLYYWSQVGRAPCSSVSITVIERLKYLQLNMNEIMIRYSLFKRLYLHRGK